MTDMDSGIPFFKMHGCGNDFILIDKRGMDLNDGRMRHWARMLCRKSFGIGADGLVFIDLPPDNGTDAYTWHFFNRDGSEGEMCGNAARCTARLAHDLGIAPAAHTFKTLTGSIQARIIDQGSGMGEVRINLPRPENLRMAIPLNTGQDQVQVHRVVVGVPHAVVIVTDAAAVDVIRQGDMIRRHPVFLPAGTNVNFVEVLDRQTLLVRTFERGVEDETFACGTGAAASVVVASRLGLTGGRAAVRTMAGDVLTIEDDETGLFLQGPAVRVFEGTVFPDAAGLTS